jgi:hypothetical protein
MVKTGAYGTQTINSKASAAAPNITIQPAAGETVSLFDLDVDQASYLTVKGPMSMQKAGITSTTNVTFDGLTINLNFANQTDNVLSIYTDGVHPNTGTIIRNSDISGAWDKDNVLIDDNNSSQTNILLEHNNIHTQKTSNDGVHMICLWVTDVQGIVIRGNNFWGCHASGVLEIATSAGQHKTQDVMVENNIFGPAYGTGTDECCGFAQSMQMDPLDAKNITLRHNIFTNAAPIVFSPVSGYTYNISGNIGPGGSCVAGVTYSKNTWNDISCSGDNPKNVNIVNAANFVDPPNHNYHAASSSAPQINAAETSCSASGLSLCIDADLNSRSGFEPLDAGPYEFTGTITNPNPPPPPPPPTPPPPGAVLIGSTVEVTPSLSDGLGSGQIEAWPFTAIASGSGTTVGLDLASGSTAQHIVVGLYSNNSGAPGSLLGTATISTPVSGWNTAIFSSSVNVTTGTQYWIAVLGTGTGLAAVQDHTSGGSCTARVSSTNGITSMPSTFTASSDLSLNQCPLSAYVLATTTGPKQGDINGDNAVNITDLSLLLSSYGQTTTKCITNNAFTCDLSTPGDNIVNIFDLSILLSKYGT